MPSYSMSRSIFLEPELRGNLAAIGIMKGKPFQPDERMKALLTEAAVIGNATSRAISFAPRDNPEIYENSEWQSLFQGGDYHWLGSRGCRRPEQRCKNEVLLCGHCEQRSDDPEDGRCRITVCNGKPGLGAQVLGWSKNLQPHTATQCASKRLLVCGGLRHTDSLHAQDEAALPKSQLGSPCSPKSSKVRMAPRQLPGSNPGVVLNLPSEMLIAAVPFVSVLVWFQSSAQRKKPCSHMCSLQKVVQ